MKEIVLKTLNLSKNFGKIKAVDDLSVSVYRGDIFGFLGPNGAGKTTTIGMIAGLIRPTSGSVEVCGHDIKKGFLKAVRKMGVLGERPSFYPYFTGRENLRVLADLSDLKDNDRIEEILELVGLSERADDKFKTYSLGMKQRLGIAGALLSRPEIAILDEPTSGLDPAGMVEVRELIKKLAEVENMAVFLSSHLLREVEQICSRIAIIDRGKLIAEGSVDILKRTGVYEVKVEVDKPEKAIEFLREVEWVLSIEKTRDSYLNVRLREEDKFKLARALVEGGFGVSALIPQGPSLEEYFLKLTQEEERDGTRVQGA